MKPDIDPSKLGRLVVGLNAVIFAADGEGELQVLVTESLEGGQTALPFGPFDPETHRTFEIGLREWVRGQTGFELGYVEQLYTFGDMGREAPVAALAGFRARALSRWAIWASPTKPAPSRAPKRAGWTSPLLPVGGSPRGPPGHPDRRHRARPALLG